MNRYLIAALYVMAGCAVTIPLKAQGNAESLRGERCRLMITNTVKIVSAYLDEECSDQQDYIIPAAQKIFASNSACCYNYFFNKTIRLNDGPLCRISHKIRAPESMCVL